MKKIYTVNAIKNLIDKYINAGGEFYELEEGCLGYGVCVLISEESKKLKQFVIKEKYLNEWSSGHTVTGYKKLPKKYEKMLERVV